MTAKKNPYKFTICFDGSIPAQAMAAEFLNQCGGHAKAHYIADAIVLYLKEYGAAGFSENDGAWYNVTKEPTRKTERKKPRKTETGKENSEDKPDDAARVIDIDLDDTLKNLSETDMAAIMESVKVMDDAADE